jgi:hypothetical protein
MAPLQMIHNIMKKKKASKESIPTGIFINENFKPCLTFSLTTDIKVFDNYEDLETYLIDILSKL